MPEGLTQTKTLPSRKTGRLQVGMPAGFISESWPASNRNGGRLQIGIPGRNKSESADKTSNLSAISVSPAPEWSIKRRLDYINWAKRVVDGLRGVCPWLEGQFDRAVDDAERSIAVAKPRS
jgi:hypothetical protein